MERKALEVVREGHVAEVVLKGPGKGNALGPDFWREAPAAFEELDKDETVRAIIVRGAGDHFTYGLDLKGMTGELGPHMMGPAMAKERLRLLDLVGELQAASDRVESCRKPVIAAVHGWCIGGGLDFIAACDIRLCSADARFSVREIKLAMVADLGSLQRLPPIIGQGHTRELAFTGKDIDADRAVAIGLVNASYPTPAELLQAARAMAEEIADNPPLSVQGIKHVMNYCADKSVADGLRYVATWNAAFLQSKDLQEAMTAFMEKRKPVFRGE
ncbi:MAG: crotonase/enoyl-CoA hydratase family protein [Myxococcota bacterium]